MALFFAWFNIWHDYEYRCFVVWYKKMRSYEIKIEFVQNEQAGDLLDLRELISLLFLNNEDAHLINIKIDEVD